VSSVPHTNRLAGETSPYLLQHAHNPVDWRPWGGEAFAAARERDVPIFLSIGYATCHWCHVMERESFESAEAAAVLNRHTVPIKVDREEHPEIDDVYMAATVIMTGSGGWPMNVFLEPKTLKPFYCGTYFPPRPAHGRPSFIELIENVAAAWKTRRDEIDDQADRLAEAVAEELGGQSAEPADLGSHHVLKAVQALLGVYDKADGGFGGAPKFPQPTYPGLLLAVRRFLDAGSRDAIDTALTHTLERMALGGMFDQVGGGFHRYSVDKHWIVPHFEKMLYDQGLLADLYARASQTYDDPYLLRTAVRICDYVLREMTSPEGGFYSAQDAEVDGREGLNYLWRPADLEPLGERAAFAAELYGIADTGNFQDPHHPDDEPATVLTLARRPEDLEAVDALNAEMLTLRDGRKQPRLDDKVLTAWNGLMIRGLAGTTLAGGDARFADAAECAATFILDRMRDSDGRLLRLFREGRAQTPAVLEDYAALALGLLRLDEALPDGAWATRAREMLDRAEADFGDGRGGFFDTREGRSDLFVRARSSHDGAVPSGSSMILEALFRLYQRTQDAEIGARAVRALRAVSPAIAENPVGPSLATNVFIEMLGAGLVEDAGTSDGDEPRPAGPSPVEIFASEETVEVGADAPGEVYLSIRIAKPHHIVAADPGPSGRGLLPLRVGLIPGSGTGVTVYCDYPDGNKYHRDEGLHIHTGAVECRVAIERNDQEWSGEPKLGVTYQACTDTACEEPRTAELAVEIVQAD